MMPGMMARGEHHRLDLLRRVAHSIGLSRRGLAFSTAQQHEIDALNAAVVTARTAAEDAAGAVRMLLQVSETSSEEPQPATSFNALDVYVDDPPHAQVALNLFSGQWASRLPPPYADLHAGGTPLFEDGRITWALAELEPVNGQRVLELGPLECGHTYMLDRAGAGEVVAVESNTRAYLRCLVVKELLGIPSAKVLLGDFVRFLEQRTAEEPPYDLAVASGVLYHMQDPLRLLELLASSSRQLFLWTHYYDDEVIQGRPELKAKFPGHTDVLWGGRSYTYNRQEYLAAVNAEGFCGGSASHSNWLSRDDLLSALDHLGLDVVGLAFEDLGHPNGPALAVAAKRRDGWDLARAGQAGPSSARDDPARRA